MNESKLFKNATLVNEGKTFLSDVLVVGERIEKIASSISPKADSKTTEINAEGLMLIPGMIDDQVHFREPGLTHKATIFSESRAAVAGGITSFMDMPNTIPNTLTLDLLEQKYALAATKSVANYSFFMGIKNTNIEEALKVNNENVCGITDDGLYFDDAHALLCDQEQFMEELFSRTETLVALHSENHKVIATNLAHYREIYGDNIPMHLHAKIRSEEACVSATKKVLEVAKKHGNRLHFFHISTAAEAQLFTSESIETKRITAEACVHHLYFSDQDYAALGAKIKWNPSVKTEGDRLGLLRALNEGKIDIIATDHAPHTSAEKDGNYMQSASGGPLVQHALPALFELYHKGEISLQEIVQKTSHNVAQIYKIKERGFLREGYFADLVLVNLKSPCTVEKENLLSLCRWSPFENHQFQSTITHTLVNGNLVFEKGKIFDAKKGKRILFAKER
jgi:dihydroorotase